mmetsp:Transcript_13482/g.54080  ORF Transcript_13482/g.54080 Transcript_13482/m.54080 type:complete len:213 (+) Transcript_13482:152-790(+)
MDQGRRDIRHTHTRDDDAKPGLPAGSATETQRHRDNTSAATRTVTSAKLVNGANKKNTSKKGRRGSVDRDAPKRETSFERAPGHMSSRGASQPSVRLDGADDIGVENRDVERPGVLDLGRSKRQRSEGLRYVALLGDRDVDLVARERRFEVVGEDAAHAGQDRRGRRDRVAVENVLERRAGAQGLRQRNRRVEAGSRADADAGEGDGDERRE